MYCKSERFFVVREALTETLSDFAISGIEQGKEKGDENS